jgi:uncharacterized protein YbjQ (UPF0145 family)
MTDLASPTADTDLITADPTNGSQPIPGYGHGNQKARAAAINRLEKQAKEWEQVATDAKAQVEGIDAEYDRLKDERAAAVSLCTTATKVAADLRSRLPKEAG